MDSYQKRVFIILVLISLVYFVIFIFPNAVGAQDVEMISIFEPDEFAQYKHPFNMISVSPLENFEKFLLKFVSYQHYYYGFPFYASSVVFALIPLKMLIGLGSTTYNMLVLRQMISVLPMILAVLVLVYLQTQYKTLFKSIFLFIFLLFIPAVVANNLWWHPDSLVVLFITLTFFFLVRDDFRFGRNFYLAAVMCGLATATKLVGLFFFLTIPTYLLWGIYIKKIDWLRAFKAAFLFVVLLGIVFLLSNPMLFLADQRAQAIRIQIRQAEAMSSGWSVYYTGGPAAWFPVITQYYGLPIFILLSFIGLGVGIWKKSSRLLSGLILTWVVPYLVYVLFVIVIKPSHFLIPIALPLFSSIVHIFPDAGQLKKPTLNRNNKVVLVAIWALGMVIILVQSILNINWGVSHTVEALNREKNNPVIQFYSELKNQYLPKLPEELDLRVYRDVRAYFPESAHREVVFEWGTTTYPELVDLDPDLLILWNQRLLDYTNEGVLERAIDQEEMEQSILFYSDARANQIPGFSLVYETDCCKAFLRDKLYEKYFEAK